MLVEIPALAALIASYPGGAACESRPASFAERFAIVGLARFRELDARDGAW